MQLLNYRRHLGVLIAMSGFLLSGCRGMPQRDATSQQLSQREAARICLATAETLEQSGYEAEAIVQYEKARQIDPGHQQVSRRLAVLYDRQGNTARALREYELALAATPRDSDLLNDLGYFHHQRKALPEAEKCYREAVAVNPQHRPAWVNLGVLLADQDRFEESYDAFIKTLTEAEAYSNLGVILAQKGRAAEADWHLRRALELSPHLEPPRAVLAWMGKNGSRIIAARHQTPPEGGAGGYPVPDGRYR